MRFLAARFLNDRSAERPGWARLAGLGLLTVLSCAGLSAQTVSQVDARAEVAAAMYAASATQAAAERYADSKLRAQHAEIERLRASTKQVRAELTAAEEKYVADLAARDRTYAQEIAVFRSAVQDIASTPEGTAALSRFNASDEAGALSILDGLRAARDAARKKRADIESAAEARRIAKLALEARAKGKLTTAEVIRRFEEVTRLDPAVHWDWVELARLYRNAGSLSDSLGAAKRALQTAGDDREREAAVVEQGNVLVAQGDGPGALAAYRNGLSIAEMLIAGAPEDSGFQSDLSICHEKIGDVLMARGDGSAALEEYRKDVAIADALAARDSLNIEWQRDASIGHDKIGDVLAAQGDRQGALAEYRKALAISGALAGHDPTNAELQRDLSICDQKIGDVLKDQGDVPSALAEYRKGLALSEVLADRDPSNTQWQLDLSVSHETIGDALLSQKDFSGALVAYKKSFDIREALTARDPANAEWQRALADSAFLIGNTLNAQGDRPAALAKYLKALRIMEALLARDPGNPQRQRDLIVCNVKVSQATGDKTFVDKALSLALDMQRRGVLAATDAWMVDELKKLSGK